MAEYICREAIIDDLEKEIEAGDVALDEDVWINKGLRIAIRDIKDIKTADVQPLSVVAEHIKERLYETAFNTDEPMASAAIEDMAKRIDFWINELSKGNING